MAETKVVASDVPEKRTCAPETNPLPVMVSENAPVSKEAGLTLVRVGTGFSSETVEVARTLGSAAVTAATVTLAGLGSEAGA